MKVKNIHIFGGGTLAHISSHFAVCAPAYGNTACDLYRIISYDKRFRETKSHLEFTKMADGRFAWATMETNEDIAIRIEELKADPNTKIIFFSCALVDWEPTGFQQFKKSESGHYFHEFNDTPIGKYEQRLDSRGYVLSIDVQPSNKIISTIRQGRKDIFLVGFKTTCGATKQEMYEKGLRLVKEGSCNLVLVNDTKTRWNMIVSPEEACLFESDNRAEVLKELVDITWHRSQLTFTQSTVVEGKPVPWDDERVPNSLRKVVDHAIAANAYKVFNKSTVGHFAVKLSDTEFLTSIRKSDFNKLNENGLVYVRTDGPDTVLAYGAKPSVGGQSQRIVFQDHPGYDCIVHFHCPLKENNPDSIPVRSQREVECGSHQCGKNTSEGLKQFGNLKAVMLDNHGPNIVFSKDIDPQEVIDFIERNFDLDKKTGGYQL